ncbi:hypothetical protein K0U27_03290 [archaeon]|nr:hypothetical protein [archaeon]
MQNTGIIMKEFFEMWSCAIRKSAFEQARKSVQAERDFGKMQLMDNSAYVAKYFK